MKYSRFKRVKIRIATNPAINKNADNDNFYSLHITTQGDVVRHGGRIYIKHCSVFCLILPDNNGFEIQQQVEF